MPYLWLAEVIEWKIPETATVGGVLALVVILLIAVVRSRTDPKLVELLAQQMETQRNIQASLDKHTERDDAVIAAYTQQTNALTLLITEIKEFQHTFSEGLTQLHSHMTTVQTGVTFIGDTVSKVVEKSENMAPSISDIIERLDKLQESVDQLKTLAEGFNTRVDEVETEVQQVKSDVTELAKAKDNGNDKKSARTDAVPVGG